MLLAGRLPQFRRLRGCPLTTLVHYVDLVTLTFDLRLTQLFVTQHILQSVLSLLEVSVRDLGSGTGQTDGRTDRRGATRLLSGGPHYSSVSTVYIRFYSNAKYFVHKALNTTAIKLQYKKNCRLFYCRDRSAHQQ